MRIAEIMSRPVETITADEAAEAAYERMRRKRIRHLIVKEGARILGVLSSRDLDGPEQGEFRKNHKVGDLMTPFAVQVLDTTPVRRAANLMRGRNIGCLPVVDSHEQVVGIVTTADLLELLGKGTEKPPRWTLARRAPRRTPKVPI